MSEKRQLDADEGENIHIPSQSQDVMQSVCDSKPSSVGKLMSDVILSVGGSRFPAHKAILAASSAVFAAMFGDELDKMGDIQNNVTITDIDPKVLGEVLVFIYTHESPNLEYMAVDLYVAAEKYQLPKLKKMCEEFLCTNITAHNVVEILTLADRYNAERMKDLAIMYISSQATCLVKTKAWKDLLMKNCELISEAFREALLDLP